MPMPMNFQNYAIQFAVTAGIVYFMGTTDTASMIQMGAISVASSVLADMAMPMIMGIPTA
jgi:hypothetical protein